MAKRPTLSNCTLKLIVYHAGDVIVVIDVQTVTITVYMLEEEPFNFTVSLPSEDRLFSWYLPGQNMISIQLGGTGFSPTIHLEM